MKNSIDQDYIRNLVQQHIQRVKEKNIHFSLRAFAKRLNVSAGGMSSFLSGKKNYSCQMLEKIIHTIVEDPSERHQILKSYNALKLQSLNETIRYTPRKEHRLSHEEFKSIRDWYYFAFLYLIETKDFQSNQEWISKRLGVSSDIIQKIIANLSTLNLIQVDETGNIHKSGGIVRTSDNTTNESLRYMHKQILTLAQTALDNLPISSRDVTSVTLPMSASSFQKARELIRKFHEDLILLSEQGEKTEVYNCNISLFPLTK